MLYSAITDITLISHCSTYRIVPIFCFFLGGLVPLFWILMSFLEGGVELKKGELRGGGVFILFLLYGMPAQNANNQRHGQPVSTDS